MLKRPPRRFSEHFRSIERAEIFTGGERERQWVSVVQTGPLPMNLGTSAFDDRSGGVHLQCPCRLSSALQPSLDLIARVSVDPLSTHSRAYPSGCCDRFRA